MSTGRLLPLKELIGETDSPLGRLLARGAETQALTEAVRRVLPAELRTHVVTAGLHGHTLHVVADAAVWAARLRYHEGDIRTSLESRQGTSLQNIRIRVRGALPNSERP